MIKYVITDSIIIESIFEDFLKMKFKDTEVKNTDIQNPKTQNMKIQSTETQNPETQNMKTQSTETQNTETQNQDIKAQSVSEDIAPRKKKHVAIIVLIGILIVLLVAVYCAIASYYRTHFFKNTYINNIDCGQMEAAQVAADLDNLALAYSIEIIGRDENGEELSIGTIQASNIGYHYTNTLSVANAILEEQNEWRWIFTLGAEPHNYSLLQEAAFDAELLAAKVRSFDAFQKGNMVAPTDAYISEYNEETGAYAIIPESMGTKLDVEQAISCVEAAVVGNAVTVNLLELGCYEEPEITSDDEKLVSKVETINQWLSTEITYDWNDNEVVLDSSVIKEWASFENGQPVLDEDAVKEFVRKNANKYDTSGKSTTFTTALGIELTMTRVTYGWKTDREAEIEALIELIKTGSKAEREPIYVRVGAQKGEDDIGDSYIEADLSNQHLYVYEDGAIVFETDFVSGQMPQNATPAGIFGLTYKTLNAVLRGRDYETPVTYWMPFFGNYGMHDATWRDTFGGDIFLTDGSHGCLNLPLDAAALIYNYVYTGSPIICYYY